MNFLCKLLLTLSLIILTMTGCNKMLDSDSGRFVKTDDYTLNSPNNGIYAMSGIYNQLQKIAERYVLLGELRGDLMDVTDDASLYLKQINNFEITTDNPYVTIKDYYAVINNCNFLIHKIDTSVVSQGEKIMYTGYAATKAIRAWTYMQIALNYGKAIYYEKPLLTTDDADKEYPQYDITQLANVLIPDLQPWKDIPNPEFGAIGELSTMKFYFPIRFLLGELYLWSGQYEEAAQEYHDLIINKQLPTNYNYGEYTVVNGIFIGITTYTSSMERISVIGTTSEHGEGSHLKDLSGPFDAQGHFEGPNMIKPASPALNNWDKQIYYDSDTLNTAEGDLRGRFLSYGSASNIFQGKSLTGYANYIWKYYSNDYGLKNSEIIPTCKIGLLYLRYAEAVNRLGKPNLAFAVLKNGLNRINMANPSIIPVSEIPIPKPAYMNFDTVWFSENIGIHARGCGHIEKVKSYAIPPLSSKEDSILYVEDQIKMELALETAFDGNRFHDLMRMALRRNDPSYLANAVAEKYTWNKEVIRNKLSDPTKWYLPQK